MLAEVMIAASERGVEALRARPDLELVAAGLVACGRAAWPSIAIDPSEFVAHVARRIDDAEDVGAAVDDVHAADLWLALACGQGNSAAIAQLDQQLSAMVRLAVARMRDKVVAEDIAQLLREKLLVRSKGGGLPKILEYSGRGPLGGWIRIAAVRTAVSATRRGDAAGMQPVTREVLLALPAPTANPEMVHLRKRYATDFKRAFEEALAELTPEDRNVLRLSLVDGLSIDDIGVVFGCHRATAARHLARCRESIQTRTRAILSKRLKLGTAELRSMMGYIQSDLDLSIQRLLAAGEESAHPKSKSSAGRKSTKTKTTKTTNTKKK